MAVKNIVRKGETSNFSFSHNVFNPIWYFIKKSSATSFNLYQSKNVSSGNEKSATETIGYRQKDGRKDGQS